MGGAAIVNAEAAKIYMQIAAAPMSYQHQAIISDPSEFTHEQDPHPRQTCRNWLCEEDMCAK